MIQQFRNLNFLNIILLVVLLFVLRIGALLDLPAEVNTGFAEFANRMLLSDDFKIGLAPINSLFWAAFIVFLQAIIFNKIINEFNIIGKASFIPALTYVLVCSSIAPFLYLTSALFCNFFVLYILFRILLSNKNSESISTMFDLGMITAIGSIFYFPFVFFLIALWISLIIFRPYNWREWGAVLLGYLLIFFFVAVYYYWNDKLTYFVEIWRPLTTSFPVFIKIDYQDYLVVLPLLVAIILGTIRLRENFFRSVVQVRKTFIFLFNVFLIAIFSFYIKVDYKVSHFLLAVIPVAAVLSYYFMHATKKWFYESLFLLTVIFIIVFQLA